MPIQCCCRQDFTRIFLKKLPRTLVKRYSKSWAYLYSILAIQYNILDFCNNFIFLLHGYVLHVYTTYTPNTFTEY
jgi:hypothetical protein